LSEDDYSRILEARSARLQNRLSPILKAMTFPGEPSARELLAAIQYFKDKDGAIDKTAPLGFSKPVERDAVTAEGKFRVSLYKALLFLHLQNAIKSGTLNLQHSYKYRPLDDYLIERERWRRDKELLLERAGLQALAVTRRVLDHLDEALHAQYLTTNRHTLEGKNPFIKFGQKGAFSLTTPTQEDSEAEPLQTFFPERHYVLLLEVLATVNRYSNFLDEFQHWQQRHHRGRPSANAFYAGLISIGCAIGSLKMARISHPINESEGPFAR
jgi:Tn3 transposase DDE domain